jgi:tRNA threonylcarbamoyladenosine biosynthesis protein TsaB
MKLLAVETSTERCSVALTLDGAVHSEEVEAGQSHSRLLSGMILALLERHGQTLQDLDGLAFGSGPGAFTGLRIGCSVVQGMAFGLGCNVAPVGTLEALAEQADADRVITALDARMGETYFAAWERKQGDWQAVVAPCLLNATSLPTLAGDEWTGIGSGFDRHEYVTMHFAGNTARVIADRFPSAREVAQIALRIFARGCAVPPEDALPLYIRDKVAMTTDERLALRAARDTEAEIVS